MLKKFFVGIATLFTLIGMFALPSVTLAQTRSTASPQNTTAATWSLWHEVPGNGVTRVALATTSYAGKDFVFARGTDNKIYVNTYNASNNVWSGWSQVPGNGRTY